MAHCLHCRKELSQDKLESIMDTFEPGDHSQDILYYCEYCDSSINIIHRKFLYYIEAISEKETNQMIGAK